MTIRSKLLLGCLGLTLITTSVGGFAILAQWQIGSLADRIHVEGVEPIQHFRSAQTTLVKIETRLRGAAPQSPDWTRAALTEEQASELSAGLQALDAAIWRAGDGVSTETAREKVLELRKRISVLRATGGVMTGRLLLREVDALNRDLADVVEISYGYTDQLRAHVRELVDSSVIGTWGAMGLAVALSLLISHVLSRAIIPPLRNAVAIAKSIASGNLQNAIKPRGRGETSELLAALDTMQSSIAEQIKRIEQLRTAQANSFSGAIEMHSARWEAALNNMSQGLCLFDRDLKLVIYNKRFRQLFGDREIGLPPTVILQDPFLRDILAPSDDAFFISAMPDGRVFAISRQWIEGGGLVATLEDITERHTTAERLKYMARHDGLTDLPNRVQFRERLEEVLNLEGMAVLSLDLDGFKAVNDTLGHPIGDTLLRAVSDRLLAATEKDDLVARIGGDEFAIIQIARPQPAAARGLAQRIIEEINQPFNIDHHRITIGVSVGVILGTQESEHPGKADALIKNVDLALYRAKDQGRNTHRFFEPEMSAYLERRRKTEIDLASALDRGELELFYQPFFNVERQQISGFEALIRWRHPERGMISPSEFIPIAEETGLINAIGLWALGTACEQAATWPFGMSISVNLSPMQFQRDTLLNDVKEILDRTGLEPGRLQLEVTESLMLQDTDTTLAVLQAFRSMGIRVSMDDFGTGYSSLGYLTKFPFDKVKIDQSFVRNLEKPENFAVVRAVIGLSRSMGLSVIAEGVETKEQYDVLKDEGCIEMQGYYFSKPRPLSDLPSLLMRHDRLLDRTSETSRESAVLQELAS